jgi:hypothetical protein
MHPKDRAAIVRHRPLDLVDRSVAANPKMAAGTTGPTLPSKSPDLSVNFTFTSKPQQA